MLQDEQVTEQIIGGAIKVHQALGPGLLESVYEACLAYELTKRGLPVRRQVDVPVMYDEVRIDCGFRADLIVVDRVLVELKAVEKVINLHQAQLMTYLRLSGIRTGLLINFNVPALRDGIMRRVI